MGYLFQGLTNVSTKALSPIPKNPYQLTPQAVREAMLKAAGVTPEIQAKLLRRAVAKVAKQLKAKKTITLGLGGTMEVDDNMAQLRAAEQIIKLTGAEPSKDINAAPVKVIVDIKLPDWGSPPTVDVTPSTLATEVSGAETVEIPRT